MDFGGLKRVMERLAVLNEELLEVNSDLLEEMRLSRQAIEKNTKALLSKKQ